jgi:hypothetical protein
MEVSHQPAVEGAHLADVDPTLLVAGTQEGLAPTLVVTATTANLPVDVEEHAPQEHLNAAESLLVDDLNTVTANDLDDLVATMSSHGGSVVSDGLGMASVATPVGGFTLHDLFGQYFHTGLLAGEAQQSALTDDIVDPELLDSRTYVEKLFGRHVDEAMIDPLSKTSLTTLMQSAATADARADVEGFFGVHVKREHLKERLGDERNELRGGFAILHATLPKIPHELAESKGELWLAELPKVDPNRQVLHVDPTIFRPSVNGVSIPPSNDRRLFTTQNIIRWTYLKERKEVLSNARLVTWSDGSRTIHVGRDRFEVAQSSQNSLSLLGAPTKLYKSDKVMPGMVGVQSYDNRVLIKVSDAPSISSEIVGETQMHREIGMERRLSFATDAPLPRVDAKKPKQDMTSEEQWVLREREARRKEMARREAIGHPMSVLEQLEEERKMMHKLQLCTNIKDLLQEQEAEFRGHTQPTGASGRYREPETDDIETEYARQRAGGDDDDDGDEEVQLGRKDNLEDIMASINTKRARTPDQDDTELQSSTAKQHRIDDAAKSAAVVSSSASDSDLWNVETVRKSLTAAQSSLPPGSNVEELVGSIVAMLSTSDVSKWTAPKLQAEVKQVITDIQQELGSSHAALERLSSLRAQL